VIAVTAVSENLETDQFFFARTEIPTIFGSGSSHPGQSSFNLGKMVGKKFTFLQAFSNVSKDLVLFLMKRYKNRATFRDAFSN
jgi:hypothetical protein